MKNIVLDLMMGLICILCILSVIGLFVIGDVLEYWKDMRSN